jgi:hypothetical protein
MAAEGFNLQDAIQAIGVARVFIGNPFVEGGLVALPTEGAIEANVQQTLNRLTAPELTGEVAHDAWVIPGQTTITVPVIYGDPDLFELFSAHGSPHEGFTSPQRPVRTSLVIIPLLEMNQTVDPPTISYNGSAWDPAPPARSFWFWSVVPVRPNISMAFENGGKVIIPVSFEVFFASADEYDAIPNGQRVYTYGDPAAAGVEGLVV